MTVIAYCRISPCATGTVERMAGSTTCRPLAERAIRWYSTSARDLPWRRSDATPWGVLVSGGHAAAATPVARVVPVYLSVAGSLVPRRRHSPRLQPARDPGLGSARLPVDPAAAPMRGGDHHGSCRGGTTRARCAAAPCRVLVPTPLRAVAAFAYGQRHPCGRYGTSAGCVLRLPRSGRRRHINDDRGFRPSVALLPAVATRAARASAAFMSQCADLYRASAVVRLLPVAA